MSASSTESLLSVCGLCIHVRIVGQFRTPLVTEAWQAFGLNHAKPDAKLVLRILPDTEELSRIPVLDYAHVRSRYRRRAQSELVSLQWNHLAILDPAISCLEVFLLHSDRAQQQIEAFVFLLLTCVLAPRGGLLVHGSGLMLSEIYALVTGPSGAGKSTSARMIAPDFLLSDDMVGITEIDQEPIIWATPLGGPTDGPMSGPLRAIFFPKKASRFSIEPLRPHDAFLKYWAEHSEYIYKLFTPYVAMYFKNAYELFQKVPAYELAFSLDDFDREAVRSVLENPQAWVGSGVIQR